MPQKTHGNLRRAQPASMGGLLAFRANGWESKTLLACPHFCTIIASHCSRFGSVPNKRVACAEPDTCDRAPSRTASADNSKAAAKRIKHQTTRMVGATNSRAALDVLGGDPRNNSSNFRHKPRAIRPSLFYTALTPPPFSNSEVTSMALEKPPPILWLANWLTTVRNDPVSNRPTRL